ncbi:hypothetical protein [Sorangium cellulosum]|nr:hypothetical protein [Sorangium cellulosum]
MPTGRGARAAPARARLAGRAAGEPREGDAVTIAAAAPAPPAL